MDELRQSNPEKAAAKERATYESTMATNYLVSDYASEQTIDEIRYEYLGNYLRRPESVHNNKVKVIVHHTAGDYTSLLTGGTGVVKKYLQDVYKYHTVSSSSSCKNCKGWGDIGYHFLIDPFGNIYEGRAGGE